MNSKHYREILKINQDCPNTFSLPAIGHTTDGLLVTPKIYNQKLCYIRLNKQSQAIVELSGSCQSEYAISGVLNRYPIYTFFSEMIKTFYRDYPGCVNSLGTSYAEHLLRNLQWDIIGNTLVIGNAKLGWYLFRREGNEYKYAKSFCGSKELGSANYYINNVDAMLRDFRAERYFIKDENHIVFSCFNEEEYWYLYEIDLHSLNISAFYPIGECYDVQYLHAEDQYVLFGASHEYAWHDLEDRHRFWNGQVTIGDSTGQPIRLIDFGPQKRHVWFSTTAPYRENDEFLVWYTNNEPAYTEVHILDKSLEKFKVITCENFINVYFNTETNSFIVIQNNGDVLQVYETDIALEQIKPIANIKTTALRARIWYIGKTADGILLQIDHSVYCVRTNGIERVVTGHSYDEYEPDKISPCLFEHTTLMYGDYYNMVRMHLEKNTMNIIFAEPSFYANSLPAGLFDSNGLLDFKLVERWMKDNKIERRKYILDDDIHASQNRKFSTQVFIDSTIPPNESFWLTE